MVWCLSVKRCCFMYGYFGTPAVNVSTGAFAKKDDCHDKTDDSRSLDEMTAPPLR